MWSRRHGVGWVLYAARSLGAMASTASARQVETRCRDKASMS
ncbi:hypothetical protein CFBP7900_06390 [Xanthomonas hortorum pv. carotae]|uniref:Uncharacterized protein n=1 Tax=Xanthomonas hortorum pv. carotae TaxID=487904 RepID=A0A6V7C1L2_9XANT|nr:hypothetical protein XHC_0518 [Xanthomonas hortorum pv. carotae str. M081]CAD0308412.1 hypothetical protein CFBP7900_06390 [Xanthomonas hortorum pv. carotae]CAD0308421.1 hypothetical protein CFBP7900_06390 [Xanthomonas hortorum pv. carotae]